MTNNGAPQWQGWGNDPIRRAMGGGGDGLWGMVIVALVFGVPGIVARSWILLVIGGIAALGAGFAIAARIRNR